MEWLHTLVDWVLHLDHHLGALIGEYGVWTYGILFLIVFLETGLVVTPFLPGDSLLFAAGAFAAAGSLEPVQLSLLLIVAAVAGNSINYSIGRAVGPKIFHFESSQWFNRKHLDRTHEFYERHGGKAIVLGRFMPIIRTFVPFVAGIGRMTYWRFQLFNGIGAVAWVVLFIAGGYFFGNLDVVKRNFSFVMLAIIAISLLPIGIGLWQERTKKSGDKNS